MRRLCNGIAVAVCGLCPVGLVADVADSAANGFTVKATVTIQAAPAVVYQKLVRNVGDWWDPGHTFSGDARNLMIDAKPMGCFCEKLPNEGGVRHLEVVFAAPGKTLVMTGGLGPLQSLAGSSVRWSVSGTRSKNVRSSDESTILIPRYFTRPSRTRSAQSSPPKSEPARR